MPRCACCCHCRDPFEDLPDADDDLGWIKDEISALWQALGDLEDLVEADEPMQFEIDDGLEDEEYCLLD